MVAACKVEGVDMGHRVDLVEGKWGIFEYLGLVDTMASYFFLVLFYLGLD